MVAEPQIQRRMQVFNAGLNIYRRTLKRVRPLHVATHWILTHTAIPFLELVRQFKTMPDDPFWFRLELLTHQHEPETVACVRTILKPGMTVLDVGAHVGYYARLSVDLVGSTGRIVAFEPHPRNYSYLQGNVGHYPQVTLLQQAAAETEGTAQLFDYLMMSASGSLHYDESLRDVQMAHTSELDVAPRLDDKFQMQTFHVRTAPIDDVLAELNIQSIDFVKMDIEGAEMSALRGMRQAIQNSPRLKLIMEYNPMGLKAFGHTPAAAIQEVLALGFDRVEALESDGTRTDYTHDEEGMQRLTARLTQNMGVINLLFSKNS
jgi:FkbM family methyltransferase